jgi:hypothetical protein
MCTIYAGSSVGSSLSVGSIARLGSSLSLALNLTSLLDSMSQAQVRCGEVFESVLAAFGLPPDSWKATFVSRVERVILLRMFRREKYARFLYGQSVREFWKYELANEWGFSGRLPFFWFWFSEDNRGLAMTMSLAVGHLV